jgi:hypothetical protein
MIIAIWVDDTIGAIHPNDEAEWEADKVIINAKFPFTDLGDCKWILNMALTYDRVARTITLSQEALVLQTLPRFGLSPTKLKLTKSPHTNPDTLVLPSPDKPEYAELQFLTPSEITTYQSLIGSLLYLSITTRIDIAFMVNVLCRYQQSPTTKHWYAALRVLSYLGCTATYGLKFCGSKHNPKSVSSGLVAFCDSDYAGDTATRRSTTGMIILMDDTPIFWRSKRQGSVTLSSSEAEYIAISQVLREVMWLRGLYQELFGVTPIIPIYTDNESAIAMVKRPNAAVGNTKHIATHVCFSREDITERGNATLHHVPTQHQLADILTKAVTPLDQFYSLRDQLLCDLSVTAGSSTADPTGSLN